MGTTCSLEGDSHEWTDRLVPVCMVCIDIQHLNTEEDVNCSLPSLSIQHVVACHRNRFESTVHLSLASKPHIHTTVPHVHTART